MKFKILFSAVMAMTSVFAYAGVNAPILQNVSQNVILKTYSDLANGAVNLQNSVRLFTQQPNASTLAAARQAWRDMRVHWESSEAFLFGPVESLGIDPTIDTWPLNKKDLDNILNKGDALTPDYVRRLGTNLQGFHVTEYILFGSGVNGPNKSIGEFNQRQFDYLNATTQILVENTAKLARAWATNSDPDHPNLPGYYQFLAQPGRSNPYYKSEGAVMVELVKGMIAIVDEVANGKLIDPMGGDISHADPTLVESPFSWNSLNDFSNNIRSVLYVYTGSNGAAQGAGLRDFVRSQNGALAQQVEQGINQSIALILAVAGPQNLDFRQAIVDQAGRQRIGAASKSLNDLKMLLEKKVLPLVQDLD